MWWILTKGERTIHESKQNDQYTIKIRLKDWENCAPTGAWKLGKIIKFIEIEDGEIGAANF